MYEYRVCGVQQSRVTFVNGGWQGAVAPETEDTAAAINSCPQVWDYLQSAGYDGWELAAAIAHDTKDGSYEVLYLRRER